LKILVVVGSPRKGGHSEGLADAFIRGAEAAGNEVRKYTLAGKNIHGCLGCHYCITHGGECVQKDDLAPIIEEMRSCDMLVLATPTYYYSMPAQTKMVLDRMYARHGKPLSIRYSGLLVTLADSESETRVLQEQYKVAAQYMNWKDLGVVCAGGMNGNTIDPSHPALKEAEEYGRSLRL